MASNEGFIGVNNDTPFPTIHIVSDSLGSTGSFARPRRGGAVRFIPTHTLKRCLMYAASMKSRVF